MRIHHQTTQALHSDWKGLSDVEAERRLREFGRNRVEKIQRTALAIRFLRNFTHFFALILWLAAGLAFLAEFHAPGEGMSTLGGAIVAVIVINGAFSFFQEYRAEKAFAALQLLLPRLANVIRGGQLQLNFCVVAKGARFSLPPGSAIACSGLALALKRL